MYGFQTLCEISKVPFEISHKILNPYTAKYAFNQVLTIWRLMISYSYGILSLSEMGPCSVGIDMILFTHISLYWLIDTGGTALVSQLWSISERYR